MTLHDIKTGEEIALEGAMVAELNDTRYWHPGETGTLLTYVCTGIGKVHIHVRETLHEVQEAIKADTVKEDPYTTLHRWKNGEAIYVEPRLICGIGIEEHPVHEGTMVTVRIPGMGHRHVHVRETLQTFDDRVVMQLVMRGDEAAQGELERRRAA